MATPAAPAVPRGESAFELVEYGFLRLDCGP